MWKCHFQNLFSSNRKLDDLKKNINEFANLVTRNEVFEAFKKIKKVKR